MNKLNKIDVKLKFTDNMRENFVEFYLTLTHPPSSHTSGSVFTVRIYEILIFTSSYPVLIWIRNRYLIRQENIFLCIFLLDYFSDIFLFSRKEFFLCLTF